MHKLQNFVLPLFFLAGVALSVVLLLPVDAQATTPIWEETFDSYNTGDLTAQGNWLGGTGTDVSNLDFVSSPNSIDQGLSFSSQQTYIDPGTSLTTSDNWSYSFDFYVGDTSTADDGQSMADINFPGAINSTSNRMSLERSATSSEVGIARLGASSRTVWVTNEEWHTVVVNNFCDGVTYPTWHVNFTVDGVDSGWYDDQGTACITAYSKLQVDNAVYTAARSDDLNFIDNIRIYDELDGEYTPPLEDYEPIIGNYPSIYLSEPTNGTTTATTSVDFTINGYVAEAGILQLVINELMYGPIIPITYETDVSGYFSADFLNIPLTATTTYNAYGQFYAGTSTNASIFSNTVKFNVIATSTYGAMDLTEPNYFINEINRFWYRLQHRAPWAYVFLLQEKIGEMTTTYDGSVSDFDIVLPMASTTAFLGTPSIMPDITIFSFVWLTASSTYMGQIWDEWLLLNQYAGYILWLMLLFYFVHSFYRKTDKMGGA